MWTNNRSNRIKTKGKFEICTIITNYRNPYEILTQQRQIVKYVRQIQVLARIILNIENQERIH